MIFNRIDYNYFIRYFYTFRFEIIFKFRQIYLVISYLNFFFNEHEFHHISFLSIVPSNSPVADAFYSRFNFGERGFIESRILFDSIHGVLCKSIRNSVPVARKVPEYNSHGKTILLLSSIVIEIITQLFNLPPSTHAAAIGSCMILARALREKKEGTNGTSKRVPSSFYGLTRMRKEGAIVMRKTHKNFIQEYFPTPNSFAWELAAMANKLLKLCWPLQNSSIND